MNKYFKTIILCLALTLLVSTAFAAVYTVSPNSQTDIVFADGTSIVIPAGAVNYDMEVSADIVPHADSISVDGRANGTITQYYELSGVYQFSDKIQLNVKFDQASNVPRVLYQTNAYNSEFGFLGSCSTSIYQAPEATVVNGDTLTVNFNEQMPSSLKFAVYTPQNNDLVAPVTSVDFSTPMDAANNYYLGEEISDPYTGYTFYQLEQTYTSSPDVYKTYSIDDSHNVTYPAPTSWTNLTTNYYYDYYPVTKHFYSEDIYGNCEAVQSVDIKTGRLYSEVTSLASVSNTLNATSASINSVTVDFDAVQASEFYTTYLKHGSTEESDLDINSTSAHLYYSFNIKNEDIMVLDEFYMPTEASAPYEVTVSYANSIRRRDALKLDIFKNENGAWVPQNALINTGARTLTANLDSSGEYAVIFTEEVIAYPFLVDPDEQSVGTVGSMTLDFPAGAVNEDTSIDISVVPDAPNYQLSVFGTAFTIEQYELNATEVSSGDDIHQFNDNLTMTISYQQLGISNFLANYLDIYWYNPDTGIWESQDAVVDKTAKTVTIQVDHFSEYALMLPGDFGESVSKLLKLEKDLTVLKEQIKSADKDSRKDLKKQKKDLKKEIKDLKKEIKKDIKAKKQAEKEQKKAEKKAEKEKKQAEKKAEKEQKKLKNKQKNLKRN